MKIKSVFITLFIITFLFSMPTQSVSQSSMSAEDLYSAFKNNEVRANDLYKGKTFRVYGKAKSIDTLMGYAFVTLRVSIFSTHGVQCNFVKDNIAGVSPIDKGDRVIIEGTCAGYSMLAGVQMSNCKVIKIY